MTAGLGDILMLQYVELAMRLFRRAGSDALFTSERPFRCIFWSARTTRAFQSYEHLGPA
jgi:hypothetical protein